MDGKEQGDEGVFLKDGFLRTTDLRFLSLHPPSQTIHFELIEAINDFEDEEQIIYPERYGTVFPSELGYQELRAWWLNRQRPGSLDEITHQLHQSYSYHVEQTKHECTLQWHPVEAYTLFVTEQMLGTTTIAFNNYAHNSSSALATLLWFIGFHWEDPDRETQHEGRPKHCATTLFRFSSVEPGSSFFVGWQEYRMSREVNKKKRDMLY